MELHGICHVEWSVTDFERTSRFYGALFGWNFHPHGDDYLLFMPAGGGIGGGFVKATEVTPSQFPSVYILVNDVEEALKRATELGGTQTVPKTPVDNMGWFANFKDLDGNSIGVWQSATAEA